jgi:hypothetical protein
MSSQPGLWDALAHADHVLFTLSDVDCAGLFSGELDPPVLAPLVEAGVLELDADDSPMSTPAAELVHSLFTSAPAGVVLWSTREAGARCWIPVDDEIVLEHRRNEPADNVFSLRLRKSAVRDAALLLAPGAGPDPSTPPHAPAEDPDPRALLARAVSSADRLGHVEVVTRPVTQWVTSTPSLSRASVVVAWSPDSTTMSAPVGPGELATRLVSTAQLRERLDDLLGTVAALS